MRAIKFRGLTHANEWFEGYLLVDKNNRHSINWSTGDFDNNVEVILESVGEFTGLKDKNGKEIYEGDIVRAHLRRRIKTTTRINEVKWCGDDVGWRPFCEIVAYGDETYMYEYFKNCEVIGNKFENPEKLDG